jgi:hypothetical protein
MHAKIAGRALVEGSVHVEAEMLSTFVERSRVLGGDGA